MTLNMVKVFMFMVVGHPCSLDYDSRFSCRMMYTWTNYL